MEKKNLFFQGNSRIGKSTYLREGINRSNLPLVGFTVQRLHEGREVIGYQVLLVDKKPLPPVDIPYSKNLDGIFLLHGEKKLSVLEQVIAEAEQKIEKTDCRFVVLDEIGGMELTLPLFMQPLMRILSGTKPCIGILKSKENLKHTVSVFSQENTDSKMQENLERLIREQGELYTITAAQVQCVRVLTEQFLEKIQS